MSFESIKNIKFVQNIFKKEIYILSFINSSAQQYDNDYYHIYNDALDYKKAIFLAVMINTVFYKKIFTLNKRRFVASDFLIKKIIFKTNKNEKLFNVKKISKKKKLKNETST